MAPALDEALATEAGRLATFERAQQISKRRASSTKKKASNVAEWPHETLSAEEFAHAGFYYNPTPHSLDNVECFLCRKNLDNWEPGDNPIAEHLSHVPDCGWAINARIEQSRDDHTYQEQDPLGEYMTDARRATFREGVWPHQGKRGWKCQIKKMVDAGWTYAPTPDADDCVYCFYCQMTLDGWEPKDDPYEEHYRRNSDCEFFALATEFANSRPKKGKKASARGSKASRMSTQSNATADRQDDSVVSANDMSMAEGDSILSTTSKKGRKKAAPKKANTKKKRLHGSTATDDSVLIAGRSDADLELPEPELLPATDPEAKPKARRATRQKKTATIETDAGVPIEEEPIPPSKAKASKRTTRKKETAETETAAEGASVAGAKAAAKGKRTTRQKAADAADELSQVQGEQGTSMVLDESRGRPVTRGKKRGSNGAEKVDSSLIMASEEAGSLPAQVPTRSSDVSMSDAASQHNRMPVPAQSNEQAAEEHGADAEDELQQVAPPPVTKSKAKKGKQTRASSDDDSQPLQKPNAAKAGPKSKQSKQKPPAVSTSGAQDADLRSAESHRPSTESVSRSTNGDNQPSPQSRLEPGEDGTEQNDMMADGASDLLKTGLDEDTAMKDIESHGSKLVDRAAEEQEMASEVRVPAAVDGEPLSPASSTGSSDAENRPPSASQVRPPSAVPARKALEPVSPTDSADNQKRSGPKVWRAIDMEALLSAVGSGGQENLGGDMGPDSLTSPEKKMTVEEWIYHNSAKAEDKLRRACEGMISGFEKEGVRALQVLEGVDCD